MNPAICIELPYPDKVHSHNKGHWANKTGDIKSMRHAAKLVALDAMNRGAKPIHGKHKISYLFSVKDNRRRDRANMVQQCKAYVDGIVESGLIEGDHWQISELGSVEVRIDKAGAAVIIQIEDLRNKASK
jgi:undecaprenyl pyrophosphate synthase